MLIARAEGQGGFTPPLIESAVTRQFDQVDALLTDELWDEAIDRLESIQAEHGGKLIAIAPGRFVTVAEKCQQRLVALPPEGLSIYRQRSDAVAERLLTEGVDRLDSDRLTEVVEEFLATTSGAPACIALGELYLSHGWVDAARRLLERATPLATGPAGESAGAVMTTLDTDLDPAPFSRAWRSLDRPTVVAAVADDRDVARALTRLASCDLQEGALERAVGLRRLLEALCPACEGRIAGRPQSLASTLEMLTSAARVNAEATVLPGERLGPLVAWRWRHALFERMARQRLTQLARQRQQQLFQRQLGIVQRRGLNAARAVSVCPAVAGERVVWIESGKLQGIDRPTGESVEIPTPEDWTSPTPGGVASAGGANNLGGWRVDGGLVIRGGRVRVLNNRGRLTELPAPTVSWVGSPVVRGEVAYGRVSRREIQVIGSNRRRSTVEESLVGIDLSREGKLVFEAQAKALTTGGEPAAFAGGPIVDGDRLYAFITPRTNRGAVSLVCYQLAPQREVWRTSLGAGAASRSPRDLNTLLRHGDTVYACTAAGGVLALDADTGRIRWATEYTGPPSTPRRVGALPRQLLVRAGVLYAAPADACVLVALNASSGATTWSAELAEAAEVVWATPEVVVVAGESLEWRDAATGALRHAFPDSRHAGLVGVGRTAVVGNELFWPGRNAVHAIDARTGRFTRPEIPTAGLSDGPIDAYAAGDELLLVGPTAFALRSGEPAPAEPVLGRLRPTEDAIRPGGARALIAVR
ncbi:MAG: PQQ-binding-like beta-propeller repeat protein [Planctomycetota bacterium]